MKVPPIDKYTIENLQHQTFQYIPFQFLSCSGYELKPWDAIKSSDSPCLPEVWIQSIHEKIAISDNKSGL